MSAGYLRENVRRKAMSVTFEEALAAKERAKAKLAAWFSIINGIGLTKVGEDWAVSVNLTRPPPANNKLPDQIDGVRLVVEVFGVVRSG